MHCIASTCHATKVCRIAIDAIDVSTFFNVSALKRSFFVGEKNNHQAGNYDRVPIFLIKIPLMRNINPE